MCGSVVASEPGRSTIDKIAVRVNGTNILQSDLDTPRIAEEGGVFTTEKAIVEEILYQRAAEMHLLPSALDIERQVVAFKLQNNFGDMTDQEFEDQLRHSGFTLKMYKHQMGRLIAVENVRRAEISEKIVITSQEVEDYYKAHPESTREEYKVKICTIPADHINDKDAWLKESPVAWEDLGWVATKDIKRELSVITSMQKGAISEPLKVDKVYQLVMVEDKHEQRLKTLDERYGDIERTLQLERRGKFLEQFEKDLKEKASIIYL